MGRSLQHSFLRGLYLFRGVNRSSAKSSTNLNHFYPVAERAAIAALPIPLDGIGRGAAGIRRAYPATTNQHHINIGVKSPLLKVLESLENFFQEVFKWDLGQRPKVFPPAQNFSTGCGKACGKKRKAVENHEGTTVFCCFWTLYGRKRGDLRLWKNESLDFSDFLMYNI